MMYCKFCGKESHNNKSLSNHQVRCKNNPDRRIQTMSEEAKKKNNFSENAKKYYLIPENRKKHSERMKDVVLKHPNSYSIKNVSGRCKNIEYKGFIFKGSWEVIVAKFLDENNIIWERDIKPIPYLWKESYHLYFPDFYLPDYKLYIEVKGYATDRDFAKWKNINNLKVLMKKEINMIKEKEYSILNIIE